MQDTSLTLVKAPNSLMYGLLFGVTIQELQTFKFGPVLLWLKLIGIVGVSIVSLNLATFKISDKELNILIY